MAERGYYWAGGGYDSGGTLTSNKNFRIVQ
jgi:hypothetical protein